MTFENTTRPGVKPPCVRTIFGRVVRAGNLPIDSYRILGIARARPPFSNQDNNGRCHKSAAYTNLTRHRGAGPVWAGTSLLAGGLSRARIGAFKC